MNLEKKYLLKKILQESFLKLDVGSKIWLSIDVLNIISVLKIRKKKEIENILFDMFEEINLISQKVSLIIIPAFTFEFPQTKVFNTYETKPQIGSFAQFIFKTKRSIRSLHPFYSFFIFGRDYEFYLKKINKYQDSVGDDSIFNYILENNFDLLSIGHHYASALSSIHQTEYLMNIDYREVAYFEGELIDSYNNYSKGGKYNFYVRKRDICEFSGITKLAAKQFDTEKISKNLKIIINNNPIASYKLNLKLSNEYILNMHKKTNILVDYLKFNHNEKTNILTKQESSKIYREYIK